MRGAIAARILVLFLPLFFAVTEAAAEGVCGAVSANSYTFTETNTSATWSGTVDDNSTIDYYIEINYPGTLHIEFTSNPADKVSLAYATAGCPDTATSSSFDTSADFQSDPQSLPYVINLKSFVSNNTPSTDYTFTATFTPSPIGLSKNNYLKQIENGADTNVTYTLTAYNYSSVDDTLILTDTFPAELNVSTIQEISNPGWNCTYPTAPSNTLTCTIDGNNLSVTGDSLVFTATLQPDVAANQTPYDITNTATLYEPESHYTADAASTVEAVDGSGLIDLELQKYAEASFIPADTPFKYAMFVLNHGNRDAYMINVTDTFPDGQVEIVSYDTTRGWTCPTLPPTGTDTNPSSFNCTYDSTLGSQDIAVLIINARTKTSPTYVQNGDIVTNYAEVDALNPIDNGHTHTAEANFTIGQSAATIVGGIYPENGYADASDVLLNGTGVPRSNAYLHTRVASAADQMETVYFFNDNNVTANYDEGISGAVPMTVIFRLGQEDSYGRCVLRNDNRISYDGSQVVATVLNNDSNKYMAQSNPFQMRNIADKRARLIMKYLDVNAKIAESGDSCAQSNMSSNLAGLPQCVNSGGSTKLDNNKYINFFGAEAFMRCVVGNGNPCNPNYHGKSCDGVANGCPNYNPEYDHDYGCYECTVGGSGSCARDPFAIRPKAFDVNVSDGDLFRSGKDYNLQFKALTANTSPSTEATLDYNETNSPMYTPSFSVDVNFSKQSICNDVNLTPFVTFGNGVHHGDFKFDNVATDANFSVHEDHNDKNSTFARVDRNDPGETDQQLFIQDYNATNITIIPDHFNVAANLTDYHPNRFTYMFDMNRFDGNPATNEYNLSTATLDISIKAVGEDNLPNTNYIDTCYADPDINVTMEINGSKVIPANALTQFLYHYYAAETNGTIVEWDGQTTLVQNATFTSLSIEKNASKPMFIKDAVPDGNGTVLVHYKLNFDRKVNKPADPIQLALSNVNVDNMKTDPDYNVYGEDNNTTDSATFLYGRVHAPRYRVPCTSSPCTSQPLFIYYEFYSDDSTEEVANIRRNAPLAIGDNLRSKDSFKWFQNSSHTPATDGNFTATSQKSGLGYVTQNGAIGTNGARSTVRYDYDGSMGYPYKTSIEINASSVSPWLVYDRFNPTATGYTFELEFNTKGVETMMDQSATTGDDASINTSRRIQW